MVWGPVVWNSRGAPNKNPNPFHFRESQNPNHRAPNHRALPSAEKLLENGHEAASCHQQILSFKWTRLVFDMITAGANGKDLRNWKSVPSQGAIWRYPHQTTDHFEEQTWTSKIHWDLLGEEKSYQPQWGGSSILPLKVWQGFGLFEHNSNIFQAKWHDC